jgi:hypothetical protein
MFNVILKKLEKRDVALPNAHFQQSKGVSNNSQRLSNASDEL